MRLTIDAYNLKSRIQNQESGIRNLKSVSDDRIGQCSNPLDGTDGNISILHEYRLGAAGADTRRAAHGYDVPQLFGCPVFHPFASQQERWWPDCDDGHNNHTRPCRMVASLVNIKRESADQHMEVSGADVVVLTKQANFSLLRFVARPISAA